MVFNLLKQLDLSFILSLVRFGVALGVLIFVHELGHFLVAKWRRVYVKRFSLGFGPRLISFKKGETEYRLSAFPLGGYVKMVGQEDLPSPEEPEEDKLIPKERRFTHKTTFEKLAIIIAGPLTNIAAAVLIFALLYTIGFSVPSYQATRRVGQVVPQSPAAGAGIQAGDRIAGIDGRPCEDWEDIVTRIVFSRGQPLKIEAEREGQRLKFVVKAERAPGAPYRSIGILPFMETEVQELIPGMPAEAAGLRPGDVIIGLNGESHSLPVLVEEIAKRPGSLLRLEIRREGRPLAIELVNGEVGAIPGATIERGEFVYIERSAPEEVARAEAGDRIVAVDGERLEPEAVDEIVSSRPGAFLRLEVERARPGLEEERFYHLEVEIVSRGMIGIRMGIAQAQKRYSPPKAAFKAAGQTVRQAKMWWLGLYSLFSGEISHRELTGPIGIYLMTEEVAKEGAVELVIFLAKISIILGLVNLVPLPVLDGGNLVVFALEGIRGKPFSARVMTVIQQIGLAIIALLFLLVIYNDVFYRLLGR